MKEASLFLELKFVKTIFEAKVSKLSGNARSHSFAVKELVNFQSIPWPLT